MTIPFYCRVWFAPVLIAAMAGVGALWFYLLNKNDPVDDVDYGFYLRLYCTIGGNIGLAAWYFSRLVARRRASWFAMVFLLLPAYLFITVLALDKNPSVAALGTLAAAFILLLLLLANHSTRMNQST